MAEGDVLSRLLLRARNFAYGQRVVLISGVHAAITAAAYALAFLVRFEGRVPAEYVRVFVLTLPVLVLFRVLAGLAFRLPTRRWRYVGPDDVLRLVVSTTVVTAAFLAIAPLVPLRPLVPRSVIVLEWLLFINGTAGLWIGYRLLLERFHYGRSIQGETVRRALIVGAGGAGNLLARELQRTRSGYRVVGFVDDDPANRGTLMQGVEVIGASAELPELVDRFDVDEILIAMPSAPPAQLRRIVDLAERAGVDFKVLPGIAEVLAGEVHPSQLREVRIEDLLGREGVRLELAQVARELSESVVLITGAGGSIGSELARQVAAHGARTLVLYDRAENDLFFLEMELRERFSGVRVVPVIGDIFDEVRLDRVLRTHRPDRVYHAAAYKHVPMMESNVYEALRNNVLGTLRVAEAATRHGARKFVLISTDKAVHPSSVMGATKRLAELVVMACHARYPATGFVAVRFGNVLGSNGSVIPVFRKQLAEGKPLTVTHPEVTRFFMTASEAAQLVLQASLLPEAEGRIAMLEMGDPVRI
ncbi:MAG: polysaccharide biosynthesis protein, partial [Gemmatimonadetes bacterium]